MSRFGSTRVDIWQPHAANHQEVEPKTRLEIMGEYPILMNHNSVIASQIAYLVKQLTKKNLRQTNGELHMVRLRSLLKIFQDTQRLGRAGKANRS